MSNAEGLQPPARLLYPAYAPLSMRKPPPRYVPQPQPEGTVRVILGDDYYIGPEWYDYTENSTPRPEEVFDIPQEQRDRWQAAIDTCEAMQEEIRALLEARLLSISP